MKLQVIAHSSPSLGDEEAEAASRVVRSGQVAQGVEVEAFEFECAALVGRRYGVAVSSGTAALELALNALGVCEEDRVATPTYACAALATAIKLNGAVPIPCDIGPDFNMALECIPKGCRSAVVVHLFGAPAPIPSDVPVVEDLAHSFGGGTGRTGVVAITSFYATKMMTTGEGGMVFTDDTGLAEAVRDLRDYDNREKFIVRHNYKMTDIQAAIGRVQLRRLPGFIERRRELAMRYDEALAGLPLELPKPVEGHVYYRYVVGTDRRDALRSHLNRGHVEAKPPVYRPLHKYLGGRCPAAARAWQRHLSLPLYPALDSACQERVIESVRSCFEN